MTSLATFHVFLMKKTKWKK